MPHWKERGFREVWSRAFIRVDEGDGCRAFVRQGSVQMLSDTDPLQNETYVRVSGQTFRVSEPLDQVLSKILGDENE